MRLHHFRTIPPLLCATFWVATEAPAQHPSPTNAGPTTVSATSDQPAGSDSLTPEQRATLRAASRQSGTALREAYRRFATEPRSVPTEDPSQTAKRRRIALSSQVSFVEPPVIRSHKGVLRAHLKVVMGENILATPGGDVKLALRSYNGRLVGPTLRARPGDVLRVFLDNRLTADDPSADTVLDVFHGPNTTNLHTHGLHVSPAGNSDNVLLEINGGQRFEYEIKIPEDHPAGTFWYHAHKHGSVALQVSSGMVGALIIEGGIDEIPAIAAAKERLFVLEQIPFIIPDGSDVGVVEPFYADQEFGPTSWADLRKQDLAKYNTVKHYTTVNGRAVPVVSLRPGEIQRWRFVLGGMRETVTLQLVAEAGGAPIPLHEIAADGLPLGRAASRTGIELWPGYRSDLLVEAPQTAGAYLLIDAAAPPASTLSGGGEDENYIAKVVVAGEPLPMTLPSDDELRPFRLPSIPAQQVEGTQTAVYALGGGAFTINGVSFDPTKPLHLRLGATEAWTVNTTNPFPHVFHIHVNPFEIVSILDKSTTPPTETLDAPIWRDTVALKKDQVVTFRTSYIRYIGSYVQHCHILDHEDLGMMQLVTVDPPGGTTHGTPAAAAHGATPPATPAPAPASSPPAGGSTSPKGAGPGHNSP